MNTKKGSMFVAVLQIVAVIGAVACLAFITTSGERAPLISFNNDGSKMTVYANVVTAPDGKSYRVEVSDHAIPGKPSYRLVDAYSLDGKYAEITGSDRGVTKGNHWGEFYACTTLNLADKTECERNSPKAEALLTQLVRKTASRENLIGNFEILWSWQMGTKELFNKIMAK